MPLLIGLSDEGGNVVQVLGLDGAVFEVSEGCGIANPQEAVVKYLHIDGIAFSHCACKLPNPPWQEFLQAAVGPFLPRGVAERDLRAAAAEDLRREVVLFRDQALLRFR